MKKHRLKGQGRIFKRGSAYYLQYDVAKKRKVCSLNCKKLSDAKKKAKEFLKPIDAHTKAQIAVHIAEAKGFLNEKKIKIESVWELYLGNKSRPNSSPGTLRNYQRCWGKFKKWITANHPNIETLGDISSDIAQKYADKLWSDKINWNTYNYHLKALYLIFRIVLGLRDNVWASQYIKRKEKVKNDFKKTLTEEELFKLLDAFDDSTLDVHHKEQVRVLFHIGAWTALRLADAALIKWQHIDFSKNVIKLIPLKTRKIQRVVEIPLCHELKERLKRIGNSNSSDSYVLPELAGLYIENSSVVKKDVLSVFKHIGLTVTLELPEDVNCQRKNNPNQYGFHVLRHSYISNAASRGIPVMILSKITGDDVKTLMDYYTHFSPEITSQVFSSFPVRKKTGSHSGAHAGRKRKTAQRRKGKH